MPDSIKHLGDLVREMADIFKPPERLSVSEAAEKYRILSNEPKYVGPYKNEETPYMREPQDNTMSDDYTSVVFCGPSQSGKALHVDTPIATPNGWTTIGELDVGDLVFDDAGRPTEVVFVTPPMDGHVCYRVGFDDGTCVIADADHLWRVDSAKVEQGHGGPARPDLTTQQIKESLTFGKKVRFSYAIKNPAPLDTPEVPLPMAPYTLGAWLGDGHSLGGRIYGGMEDLKTILTHVRFDGYEATVVADKKGLGVLRVESEPGQLGPSVFCALMREAGLDRKHIPSAYLRASREQRLQLLRGLMDTDGTIGKTGVAEFANTNKELIDGVCELLVSLGYKCSLRQRQTHCTYKGERVAGAVSWRVTFVPYDDVAVFYLHRKRVRQKPRAKGRPGHTERRRITSVEPVESVPVKCIQVASESHLYLAGRQMVPTHNTEAIILNTAAYIIKCKPMDVLLFGPSQSAARDFSKRRIDRMHRHSPLIGEQVLPGQHADNTHDKTYKSGMMLSVSWPSINEMSSKPAPVVMFTEYDRMPDDIEGEGSPYLLGKKRTTTFLNMAMTVVDSSPSRDVEDAKWVARTPHEAPPCKGVLGLYNQGDRRRWYWPCPHCGEYFEGSFANLVYDTVKIVDGEKRPLSRKDIAASVVMGCPRNGCTIEHHHKYDMNAKGRWLKDFQTIDRDGVIHGEGEVSGTASYWLRGTAAAYIKWSDLVLKFLDAEKTFNETGSQEDLKTTVNTDQGDPYIPRGAESNRRGEDIMDLALPLPMRKVPADVRALLAMCDVQKNLWEVQIMGIRPAPVGFDAVVVDRFQVKKAERYDEAGDRLWVKPATYLEDWDLLIRDVMDKTYELEDGSGEMGVALTLCDSGGMEGVTTNAYNFHRKLSALGRANRFLLVKGDPSPGAPRASLTYPDSKRSDRNARAQGEVPVLLLNTNSLKDTLDGWLARTNPGGGKIDFPDWLPLSFFEELTVEVRSVKGGWENKQKRRNETWDLCVYFLGACVWRQVEKVDWTQPPSWLKPWADNPLVALRALPDAPPVDKSPIKRQSFADLAADLA